jgi:uncharacterized protein YaaR (DUF327 family)
MDRIESLEAFYLAQRSERRKSRRTRGAGKSSFLRVLETTKEGAPAESEAGELPEGHGSLAELLDEVHESGEALVAVQTLENVRRYRQAIRFFVEQVVRATIAVEERTSGSDVLKRKRFTQIQVIDRKLERLLADVLQSQHRQLDILERVEEIQGLLVDLMR